MIYLYGGILGGYVTLWLVSWREKGKGPFQRMAAYLLRKREGRQQKQAGRRKNWQRDMYRRQLGNKLRTLRPEVAVQTQVQEYYVAQYSLLLRMIFAGTVICLAVWTAAHGSPLLRDGSYVERNEIGRAHV